MIIYVFIVFIALCVGMAVSVYAFGTGGKRKRIFQDIYFSVEEADGIGVIYTKTGEYSAVLKLENPVQKYCANIDSYYEFTQLFTAIAQNEHEPNLIKAIIDEDVKAVDGSRVRLRLLDDVEINETVVKSSSYLYAIMSGFSSQRVKGTINSVLVDDEIIKVSLSLYDTDGLEGLYVPSSSFRETAKDVASGAFNSNMNMNTGGNGNSLTQWGMQAIQDAYQKTSNAISKNIKKNKVNLKYGTFVYIINSKEKRNAK